jgi:hypothetical protein
MAKSEAACCLFLPPWTPHVVRLCLYLGHVVLHVGLLGVLGVGAILGGLRLERFLGQALWRDGARGAADADADPALPLPFAVLLRRSTKGGDLAI